MEDKNKKVERGFTLLETVIVLLMLHIVILIFVFSFHYLIMTYNEQAFFDRFQKDVLYAQQLAIHRQIPTAIKFFPEDHKYQITAKGKVISQTFYHKDVSIYFKTLRPPITFATTGNISRPGTLHVTFQKKVYAVVFLLGRGRMYINEV
ncbi:hypothetical protein A4U60_02600 [Priestia endophytica]|nr:hypothetical protein A4U60_02600 [Priestia endophytica]